jgi:4'-phosphopantetheinyl transferase
VAHANARDPDIVFVDLKSTLSLLEAEEEKVARLSPADCARADAFADPERRRLWRASRIATRIVLERHAGDTWRRRDFEIADGGRPTLGNHGPYFNVSHSGEAALIALSGVAAIGVDLEQKRKLLMTRERRQRIIAAAARFANEPAGSYTESDADVLVVWVKLEAAAKARGSGIGRLLTEAGVIGAAMGVDVEAAVASELDVRSLAVPDGYVAAIAANALPANIDVVAFPQDADALAEFLSCAVR